MREFQAEQWAEDEPRLARELAMSGLVTRLREGHFAKPKDDSATFHEWLVRSDGECDVCSLLAALESAEAALELAKSDIHAEWQKRTAAEARAEDWHRVANDFQREMFKERARAEKADQALASVIARQEPTSLVPYFFCAHSPRCEVDCENPDIPKPPHVGPEYVTKGGDPDRLRKRIEAADPDSGERK